MKILRIRALAGPNIYSHRSALSMQLKIDQSDERFLAENPDFPLPLAASAANSRAAKRETRKIRTADHRLAEIVKNTALDLIDRAGLENPGAVIRFSGDPGVYEIAVEYADEAATRFLLESAVEIVEAAQNDRPVDIFAVLARMPGPPANKAGDGAAARPARREVPIVAITGTNGKTTVTRLTAHTLLQTGLNVGTTTTDGILLNGEIIERGDTTGPASARKILENPAVEVAVLETARGGIMRRGLGWEWADVAVVTNITEDHIGQDGIESVADLVDIKSLIAERVRAGGTLVLNADDPESAALANRPAVSRVNKQIVYFAMEEENPIVKKHAQAGGTVYFVRENRIVEKRGATATPIAETTEIPIAMNGTADFQIRNAMAVAAVARALKLTPAQIAAGLYGFQNELHNPGRSNFYRVGKGFALIDYGHNPKAIEAICGMTSRWRDKTVTGIISFPGDRRDDVIKAAGRIAVAGFDRIVVKGDVNLRGRKSGEVADMLCRIVLETGRQSDCKVVLDAARAFDEALAAIDENEVVVFFYEKLAPALATLEKYGARPATGV